MNQPSPRLGISNVDTARTVRAPSAPVPRSNSWRAPDGGRYGLVIDRTDAVTAQDHHGLFEIVETELVNPPPGCSGKALAITSATIDGQVLRGLAMENLLIALIEDYAKRNAGATTGPPTQPATAPAGQAAQTGASPPSEKIGRVFQPDVLGLSLADFETRTGP